MTNSRQKGANFERTVAQELFRETGINFRRDLDQYRERDRGDLLADDDGWPFVIECKARATGADCLGAWEVQAFDAARGTGKHPVVIYKFNNKPIRCRVWIDAVAEALGTHIVAGQWLETNIQGFAFVAREIMARRAA